MLRPKLGVDVSGIVTIHICEPIEYSLQTEVDVRVMLNISPQAVKRTTGEDKKLLQLIVV